MPIPPAMNLHVHQAWQQDELTEIDDLPVRPARPGIAYASDVFTVNRENTLADDAARVDVKQSSCFERQHVLDHRLLGHSM